MRQGWIGVDLDGTLAEYHDWISIEHVGNPIAPMVDRVKKWIAEGTEVRIVTARVSGARDGRDLTKTSKVIEDWCLLQHWCSATSNVYKRFWYD